VILFSNQFVIPGNSGRGEKKAPDQSGEKYRQGTYLLYQRKGVKGLSKKALLNVDRILDVSTLKKGKRGVKVDKVRIVEEGGRSSGKKKGNSQRENFQY